MSASPSIISILFCNMKILKINYVWRPCLQKLIQVVFLAIWSSGRHPKHQCLMTQVKTQHCNICSCKYHHWKYVISVHLSSDSGLNHTDTTKHKKYTNYTQSHTSFTKTCNSHSFFFLKHVFRLLPQVQLYFVC